MSHAPAIPSPPPDVIEQTSPRPIPSTPAKDADIAPQQVTPTAVPQPALSSPTRVVDTTPPPAADTTSHFWLRRSDQIFFGVLVIAALALACVHWVRLTRWGTQPVEIQHMPGSFYDYRIDINSATWVEWVQLEGIGETLARRIIADRETNGPFRSIDDLQRVPGIGPKTVARIRPWLLCESVDAESGNADPPRRTRK